MKTTPKKLAMLIAVILSLSVTSLAAETYRWKDKDGKTHYGAMVPAEYADQPYDVLNNSGQVIEHIESRCCLKRISSANSVGLIIIKKLIYMAEK